MAIPNYSVVKVTNAGVRVAELEKANLHRVTYNLNGPGSAEFSFDTDDSKASNFTMYSEIQVFRGASIVFWGVIVLKRTEKNRVTCQVQGLLWYFHRRFFGRADRTNKFLNPEFESDLANWTAISTTASAETAFKKTGTKSAKLINASAGVDGYLRQQVVITSGSVGELVTLAGWFRLRSAGYVGPAFEERGLYLKRNVANVDPDIASYDDAKDAWQRREVTVQMPPNVTETIEGRWYSPGGTINVDANSLTLMESISFYNTDQTAIAGSWVTHAQDTVYGKSNLNILTNTAASGVLVDRHKQFAEHENIGSALEEWPALDNGFDYSIVITPTTRTFTTHFPKKGSFKPELGLNEAHLIDWIYSEDGETGISSLTVLGEGDGPDREEGGAVDAAAFENGLILEDVISAPTGTDVDSLDRYATERLRVLKTPRSLSVTTSEVKKNLIGLLDVGDTIPMDIDMGHVVVTGNWRVITMTIAPHDAETVNLELNAA